MQNNPNNCFGFKGFCSPTNNDLCQLAYFFFLTWMHNKIDGTNFSKIHTNSRNKSILKTYIKHSKVINFVLMKSLQYIKKEYGRIYVLREKYYFNCCSTLIILKFWILKYIGIRNSNILLHSLCLVFLIFIFLFRSP